MVHVHQMTPGLLFCHNTLKYINLGGWWEGEVERDGERQFGWFPGNYIQV